MQTVRDYLKKFHFDKIESYRFNDNRNISCTERNDKYEIIDEKGIILPNGYESYDFFKD